VSTAQAPEVAADAVSVINDYLNARLRSRPGFDLTNAANEVSFNVSALGTQYHTVDAGWHTAGGQPFIAVRLSHSVVMVSQFTPGTKPCPICLERRWVALRPMAERRAIEDKNQGLSIGNNPWLTPFALEALWDVVEAVLARRVPADGTGEAGREVYVLGLESLRLVKYQLIPDSLCPSCATLEPDTESAGVVTLSPSRKRAPASYRLRDSKSMNLPEKAFVNPACGVLGTRSYSDYQHLLTTPVSGQFHTRGTRGEHPVWWSGHATNYKESLTVALLEGLERHASILPRKKKLTVFDSYENLAEHALNPVDCGLYEPELYRTNAFFTPYTPDLKVYWVWGYSLTQKRPILVPSQLVYYTDYTRQQKMFVQDCSNGCAIGSSLEEAILSGLMELVERDSFLISWYAQLSLPRIDPWSSKSRETLFILDRIERMGYDVHLLDMRLDLGIPAVMGVTRRRDRNLGAMVFAAGCSLNPEQAVRGALCEIASYVSDFDRRVAAREDEVRLMMQDYTNVKELGHHALLYGLPEMSDKVDFLFQNPVSRGIEETYRDWMEECPRHLDLRDDIQFCLGRLNSVGLDQVIVIDQTSPEQERLGFNTACVIVPGLLPIDFGYGRERVNTLSRLFTVPRTSGFTKAELTRADLNPLPHPFP
jgi:ribosomal protein S12 methylthiotransferase accessory factor